MNISKIGVDQQQQEVSRGMRVSSSNAGGATAKGGSLSGADNVRMSALIRMISDESSSISELHRPRPEVVEKFQRGEEKVEIADEKVDAIFRKMLNV